jgi:hypothetical protein
MRSMYLVFVESMEAIRSSETSVLIRATRRHLPEDDNHLLRSLFADVYTEVVLLYVKPKGKNNILWDMILCNLVDGSKERLPDCTTSHPTVSALRTGNLA